jgi:hypothetical protein
MENGNQINYSIIWNSANQDRPWQYQQCNQYGDWWQQGLQNQQGDL